MAPLFDVCSAPVIRLSLPCAAVPAVAPYDTVRVRLADRSPPPVKPVPALTVIVLSALKLRPGTVGEAAVPPRSPASWIIPFLDVVASAAVTPAINPSTYCLLVASVAFDGVGTIGADEKVFTPA